LPSPPACLLKHSIRKLDEPGWQLVKILIYGEYLLPSIGGVQTSMNVLAKGLTEQYADRNLDESPGLFDVTVATMTPEDGIDDNLFPYRVVRRPTFWHLVSLVRGSDVVHLEGPCLLPMMIARLLGVPTLVEHHGYQAICPNGLLLKEPAKTVCPGCFRQRQYDQCVRCTSQIGGIRAGIRSVLLTFPRRWLCKGVAANIMITNHVNGRLSLPRSAIIYHGIDEGNSVPREHTLPSNEALRIACVGRLVSEKGLFVLLDAVRQIKDAGHVIHLDIIGDGPERPELEESAKRLELGGLVRFTGDLRGPDFERALNNVSVVVMPSVCEETAGLSAMEHMMRGGVVIVADIGGLGEVVGDAGLKFVPGNSRALAECILQVIANPFLVSSLGVLARARATRYFKLDRMIQNYARVYERLVSGGTSDSTFENSSIHRRGE
jgi:glycosyltransferase involved in cell wall biosynthesis